MLSFICVAESDMLQGIGPGEENAVRPFNWNDYEKLVSVVRHDLDSLEYNIYHTWMLETKKKLSKMVIPALIESQSLPGFTTSDGGSKLINRILNNSSSQPAYSMDDILNLLNKVWKSLKSYYMEESVVQQVVTELLKLIGTTSFNDLLMRRNFSSWKRGMFDFATYEGNKSNTTTAMQIQYNITRIEEWCKSHDMPEGTLQLEHLMQATKLLQLKKVCPVFQKQVVFLLILFRLLLLISKSSTMSVGCSAPCRFNECVQIITSQITRYGFDKFQSRNIDGCTIESHFTRDPPRCCFEGPS
jgi:myosin-5